MKEYFNCFIGVPLNSEFNSELIQLQKDLRQYIPNASFTETNTSHLTLYYLGKQKQTSLEEVGNFIHEDTDIIKGEKIQIGEQGIFYSIHRATKTPYVVYLKVRHSDKLFDLKEHFGSHLESYNKDDDRNFVPHFTLARLRNTKSQVEYDENSEDINLILSKINWTFKLKEIFIYGKPSINSTKTPDILYKVPLI